MILSLILLLNTGQTSHCKGGEFTSVMSHVTCCDVLTVEHVYIVTKIVRSNESYAANCVQEVDRFGGGNVMVWAGISNSGRTDLIQV